MHSHNFPPVLRKYTHLFLPKMMKIYQYFIYNSVIIIIIISSSITVIFGNEPRIVVTATAAPTPPRELIQW